MDELEKMAISDLGVGKKTKKGAFSYAHLLSPEHILKGYNIKVHEEPNDDGSHGIQAELTHKDPYGQQVAVGLIGGETDPTVGRVQLHSSHIQESHRGKGLGVPLYEAFYAHAKNKLGMTHVIGEQHSTMAAKVHQKLAEKHGLAYVPSKNTDPKPGRTAGRPYDNAYNPYEYELKYESALMFEDLNKMALGDIPVGPKTGTHKYEGEEFDYSHVLPKHLQGEFRITVNHLPATPGSRARGSGDDIMAYLHQKDPRFTSGWNTKVGRVEAEHFPKGHPHNSVWNPNFDYSDVKEGAPSVLHIRYSRLGNPRHATDIVRDGGPQDPKHLELRGRGLGLAMYEAVMAHAKNALGATHVAGDVHSSLASAAHERLAAKHGMKYTPSPWAAAPHTEDGEPIQGAFDDRMKGYNYALKSEDLSKAPGAEYWNELRQGDAEQEKARWEAMLDGFKQFHESRSQYAAKKVGIELAQEATDPDILLKLSDAIAVDPAYNGISYAISANPHVTGSVMSSLIERQLSHSNVAAATRLMRSPKADPRYVDVILDHMAQPNYRAVHYDIRDRITDLLGTAHEVPEDTLNDLMSPASKERWNTKIDNRNQGDYGAVLDGLAEYARRDLNHDPETYKKIFHTLVDNNVEYEPGEYTQANNISAMVNHDIMDASDGSGKGPKLELGEVVKALPFSSSAKHHPAMKGPDVQPQLQTFAKSPDKWLREGVATVLQNPKAMYDDPDPFVQKALLKNPNTSPEHKVSLLTHPNRGVFGAAYNEMNTGGWIRGNTHLQNQAAKHLLANGERTQHMMETAKNWAQPDTIDEMLNGKYGQDAALKGMEATNLSSNQLERIFNLKESHPDEYYKDAATKQNALGEFFSNGGPNHKFDNGYHPDDNNSDFEAGKSVEKKCVHCGKTADEHAKLSIENLNPANYHYEIDRAKKQASLHPNVAPERLDKIIDQHLGADKNLSDSVNLEYLVRKQKKLSPEQLEKIKQGVIKKYGPKDVKDPWKDPDYTHDTRRMQDVLGEVVQHPNTSAATLEDMYKNHGYITALAHKNMPVSHVKEALTNPPPAGQEPNGFGDYDRSSPEAARHSHKLHNALMHPGVHEDWVKIAHDQNPAHRSLTQSWLEENAPDQMHKLRVNVKLGMNKLRKLRDHILQATGAIDAKGKRVPGVKAEMSPKQLPAGDWAMGRVANGNISADQIDNAINGSEPMMYNVSHAKWTGAQRHNDEPSKVFQLNLTNDHVKQLKAAGVYPQFKKMQQASYRSGHPVKKNTLGWVRYTGDKKKGFFIDEIQSDFGQSFVRQAAAQAKAAGQDSNMAADRASKEYGDENTFKTISNILFKGKHPNHVLHEAFQQHLRDKKGNIGAPVMIHSVESKAPISLGRALDNQPAPGHFNVTYKDVPQKMGMERSTYGSLPGHAPVARTPGGPLVEGSPGAVVRPDAPTWADQIRKFRQEYTGIALKKSVGLTKNGLAFRIMYEETRLNKGMHTPEVEIEEADSFKPETFHDPKDTPQNLLAGKMLGFTPHVHTSFQAAQFLARGKTPDMQQVRRALWDHDGDHVGAALSLHGLEINEANRKAVNAIKKLRELTKGEDSPPHPIAAVAATQGSTDTAAAISRGLEAQAFAPIELNGKHSTGAFTVNDSETGISWILKPNAGGLSPAKGVNEETANQARREAGFWAASKLFGLQDYFPEADAISITMSDGSHNEWAAVQMLPFDKWESFQDLHEEDPGTADRVLWKYFADAMGTGFQWGFLDAILGNIDRHSGNALVHPQFNDIKLIDQGSSMAGKDFDPGGDKSSFCPFYLRHRVPGGINFNKLDWQTKLTYMPTATDMQDAYLKQWLSKIDPAMLWDTLTEYGINPTAAVERLQHFQSVEGSVTYALKLFWVQPKSI